MVGLLPIHFVVASDVEQNDLFLGDTKRQSNAVGIGDAHGMEPSDLSTERMQSKGREKGIGFEISQNFGEWIFEVWMGSRKLDDTPIKISGRRQHITSDIETQFTDQPLSSQATHSPCLHIFQ